MDTEPDYSQLMLNQSESSPPSDHQPKLKRLKKKKNNVTNPIDISNTPSPPLAMEPGTRGNDESNDDGLDPLFREADQTGVKRVLAFDDFAQGFGEIGDGSNFDDNKEHKEEEKKKRKKRSDNTSVGPDGKAKVSKRKEMQIRKAHLAQLADFQRVMRERKGVGFKPVPMVEKPISSVLAKIRQRKMEVSKKAMFSRSIQRTDPQLEAVLDDDPEENNYVFEVSDARPKKYVSVKPVAGLSVLGTSPSASPVKETSDDIAHSNDKQTTPSTGSKLYPLVAETAQPFRAPANDTQDLFSESQTSNTEDDRSTDDSDSPTPAEEDVAPSLPSLNLKFDSALPDDISSDEEESDKENIEPYPKQNHFTKNSSPKGDPVRKFVDEEALEDDSDNELLSVDDDEEEGDDDASMEELKDYVASDNKEKEADIERRNELHQMWLQQQDEAGTENILQRLKYGTTNMKQREVSLLEDEDDCCMDVDHEEDESDDEDAIDREQIPSSGARLSTKKLKQMIPHMFTDKDDGFVSSEDEGTERKLSKQRLLQRVELEEPSKFLPPAEDATSREVFSRIKKLNVVPETKKKPNTSTYFDSLLKKGGSNNSLKSSFLRRASSQPVPSSSTHGHGPSTGRSFIFGRDDSSSRTSISLPDNTSDLSQKENQPKRSASAKFIGSQTKWSTQQTEIRGETVSHTSLFELLNRSSIQTGHDARDDIVDHQAVFAAFKSVKKSVKVEGRS